MSSMLGRMTAVSYTHLDVYKRQTREGLYTNAIFGFLNILEKLRNEEQPDALAVAFDLKAPTFRHLQYEGYKATRHAMPEELEGSSQVAESDGASVGKYVVGRKGAYQDADYLEFTYNAPEAGKYQMQAFHSNEDLAGTHPYNIKIVDKYAVVEVNGQSDSPKFKLVEQDPKLYYFVDCGDHDPSTLSEGDELGSLNSCLLYTSQDHP